MSLKCGLPVRFLYNNRDMKLFLQKQFHRKRQAEGGFTLIEMMVSTSLFIITVLVIFGALISLESASRKARTIRVVSDNLSAAIDSMSRNIRMGSVIHCGCGTGSDTTPVDEPRDCEMSSGTGAGGEQCIIFENQKGSLLTTNDQFMYKLAGGSIMRSTTGLGGTFIAMTAPEMNINSLRFYAGGTTQNSEQAYVTIVIRGTASSTAKTNTSFDVQTTVSQRTPNFDLAP